MHFLKVGNDAKEHMQADNSKSIYKYKINNSINAESVNEMTKKYSTSQVCKKN